MKILKIEGGRGFFRCNEDGDWQNIDAIDKNDLLNLLNLFLEEEVEMDSPKELTVSNQAHSIIYTSIHEKLDSLSDERERFKDESERLYLEEIQKYSNP